MREIKFRAWDKETNNWVDEHTRDCMLAIFTLNKSNRYVWEQFTGLRDKNGKEIYEGDILEFEDMGEEGYETKEGYDFTNHAAVVFHEGRFCLDKFRAEGAVEEEINEHDEMVEIFKSSAVVGNVHENPELLKSS